MQIMIVRDGGATKVPKDVADMAAVDALRANGFEVEVPDEPAPDVVPDEPSDAGA